MSLQGLGLRDFRCIQTADLELHGRCNVISGENASGKTSLLEAIFYLGRGRSFRTARSETLIRKGGHELLLTGRVHRAGRSQAVGVRFSRERFEARAGGERIASLAELARVLPVQAIDPEVHRLVEEGPQERRRYLDWGVFHVEPSFVDHWRRYQRALRQRNAALRAGQGPTVVQAWNPELVEAGERVAEFRQRYLELLRPHVAAVGERLLGLPLELGLSRGWAGDATLADALEAAWPRDAERAMTHVGPHRADLSIRVGGELARDRISRGQQKLTAASMLLGQLRCDAEQGSAVAALLVDDPAAELDSAHLEKFLREVLDLPAQLFVTALDAQNPSIRALPQGHMFHVEHGVLTRLL
jgi:DNA replication and repair protein RecF